MEFRYVDLFSGIGGFRIALDKIGGKSVGFSEIDKKAKETYRLNFDDPDNHDLGDVTKIQDLPELDLIVGGVPCQSWSVAGKKRGFDDPRGRLWYDAIRMVKVARPRAFIFENVKGLADPRNKANLELIIKSFQEIGYLVKYKLVNSFDFGAPQNRSRIFIVGFREDLSDYFDIFTFPKPVAHDMTVGDLMEHFHPKKIVKKSYNPSVIHGKNIPRSRNVFQEVDKLNDFFILCDTRDGHSTIHSWDIYQTTKLEKKVCLAVLKNRRKKKYGNRDGNPLSRQDIMALVPECSQGVLDALVTKKILGVDHDGKYVLVNSKNSSGIDGVYRIFLPNSPIFSTLTATGTRDFVATEYIECDDPALYKQLFIEKILKPKKYKQISSREAARIQGFPDSFICHDSDYSAQKQFGNAVSPPVVEAIGRELLATGVFDIISQYEPTGETSDYRSSQGLDALQPHLEPH